MGVHQLCHVLVTGRDNGVHPLCRCLRGKRADDIVSLHPADLQQRQPHGTHQCMQGLYLYCQLIRHGRAIGLVVRVQLMAKGLATGIKDHRHAFRVIVGYQAAQHIDDAQHGAGRLAPGVRQLLQVGNVKGAVEIG